MDKDIAVLIIHDLIKKPGVVGTRKTKAAGKSGTDGGDRELRERR